MRRIAVLGCGGAGKSRLSRALGERLGLPVVHLDREYWRPGWTPTPAEEWEARQPALFAGEEWVADGNFHAVLRHRAARADTFIHLDFSTAACLRGVFGRILRRHGQVREDMAEGCPEQFDLEFLRWVLRFRRDIRPKVVEALAAFEGAGGRVIVLRNRGEVDAFLAALPGP